MVQLMMMTRDDLVQEHTIIHLEKLCKESGHRYIAYVVQSVYP